MSKIVAAFLCLMLTALNLFHTSQAWADDVLTCSAAGIKIAINYKLPDDNWYDLQPNSSLPVNITAIGFDITGPLVEKDQNGQVLYYQLHNGASGTSLARFTTAAPVSGDPQMVQVTTNDNRNKTAGWHFFNLMQGQSDIQTPDGKMKNSRPFCKTVEYRVGNIVGWERCNITFSEPPAINLTRSIIATISNGVPGKNYSINYSPDNAFDKSKGASERNVDIQPNGSGSFQFSIKATIPVAASISLQESNSAGQPEPFSPSFCEQKFNITSAPPPATNTVCTIEPNPGPNSPTDADDVFVSTTNVKAGMHYRADLINKVTGLVNLAPIVAVTGGRVRLQLNQPPKFLATGDYTAEIYQDEEPVPLACRSVEFHVGTGGVPIPSATPCIGEKCTSGGGDPCIKDDPRGPGFKTAIGCIHTNPPELIKDFMTFIVGISGGLAFLMMLAGAFQMLTSAGNPETLNAGRERLTSAVIGLLFVIFSVLLLQIIGVNILRIPGFGPT